MNIVFLGYTGSGKGTQAREVSRKLNLKHVSFGDIFWNELVKKTPFGHEVADYLTTGRLVPDWLVLSQLKERLAKESDGLLFDGFPRTTEQAEGLEAWLASKSSSLTAVVLLNLPEAEAMKRAAARRICNDCGSIFNVETKVPFMTDLCDSCGGKLKLREDDRPEAIKKRVMAYRDQTDPLISYYRGNAEFFEINAAQPVQTVTTQILTALRSCL